MNKKLGILLLGASFLLFLAGCGGEAGGKSGGAGLPEGEKISSEGLGELSYQEEKLPQNGEEDQQYVDRYMKPYVSAKLFAHSFSPGKMDELSDSLLPLFDVFSQVLGTPPPSEMESYGGEIPGNVVEEVLTAHLEMDPEEVRTLCKDKYRKESQTYHYTGGLGGGPFFLHITKSRKENNQLILEYDWFVGNYGANPDEMIYTLQYRGRLTLRISQEKPEDFTFLSNEVLAAESVQ